MGPYGRTIIGTLGNLARPLVDGSLELPRLGVAMDITFLVDTGADATYLHPRDGLDMGVPFDLLEGSMTSRGIGGRATYFPEPAILLFSDHAIPLRYGYRISVNIARPGDVGDRLPSLLGRNVIRRWRMDYDPTAVRLEFTVRDADFTLDAG